MGSWFSKNEAIESETIIENDVTQISGSVSLQDKEILMMLSIICLIKAIEFFYMIYKIYHRQLRKKIESKIQNRPSA